MIIYKDTHEFKESDLKDLFLSVEWASGAYPEKLKVGMKNIKTVFSAWDNERLVGLISAMDDGIMNAYVNYLLVNPAYQGKHIGKTLVDMVKEKYKDYLRISIIGYYDKVPFYEKCGFKVNDEAKPLHITSLWT